MEIKRITTDVLTFQVKFFEAEEGGMNTGEFGPVTHTPQDAIRQLELAQSHSPKTDWIIEMMVDTKVQLGK